MAATAKNVRQAVLYVLIRPWAFTALHVVRDIQWAPIPMDWEHAIKQAVRQDNISTAAQTTASLVLREHTPQAEQQHLVPAAIICSSAATAV